MIILASVALIMISCKHETLEDRAEKEAREYTEKYCPTPDYNNTHVDSMTYDRATHTLVNYCSITGWLDNDSAMAHNEKNISSGITEQIRSDPKLKTYRDASIAVRYVLRSTADPKKVWLDITVK